MARQDIEFCTLGMFIIDEIHPAPSAKNAKPQLDIIGGAGTYSAIGARLFSPPPKSLSVGWIVDTGTDFPNEVHETIVSWQTGVVLRSGNRLTTRGWNGYGENEHRAFKYLTEKKRITAEDLTPALLLSKSFHLICGASRCIELVSRILERRSQLSESLPQPRPLFIWEPVPDLCIPSELDNIERALRYVDIVSPNHDELAALWDFKHLERIDLDAVKEQASRLSACGIGHLDNGAVVVRCGKQGSLIMSKSQCFCVPAYHQDQVRVIDPTGGGNGFLGGFAIGMVRTGDLQQAALYGSVSASLCIEQVGLPVLDKSSAKDELWNRTNVFDRLDEMRSQSSKDG